MCLRRCFVCEVHEVRFGVFRALVCLRVSKVFAGVCEVRFGVFRALVCLRVSEVFAGVCDVRFGVFRALVCLRGVFAEAFAEVFASFGGVLRAGVRCLRAPGVDVV